MEERPDHFLIIAVAIVILGVSCNMGVNNMLGTAEDDYDYNSDYIGVLALHGTITEESGTSDTYNQQWLMARVKQMKNDSYNKGLILSIDTPGGSVYATDELYLQIKEYAEETGRPVYTYMESTAAFWRVLYCICQRQNFCKQKHSYRIHRCDHRYRI